METRNDLVKWPKVVLFGDSLVQMSFDVKSGWGSLLANKFQRICDVETRGFAGYTSRFGRVILPQIVSAANITDVAAFVILLGANDSGLKNGLPNVSLEDYEKNLEAMIDYLQGIGLAKEKIILISPPPFSDEDWTNYCKRIENLGRNLPTGKRQTSCYASACIDLAKKKQTNYLDLYGAMTEKENWRDYLIDGLHFNEKGAQLLFDNLLPIIQKLVGEEMLFPNWRDFDEVYKL